MVPLGGGAGVSRRVQGGVRAAHSAQRGQARWPLWPVGGFRRLVSGVKPSFTRDRPPWRLREAEPSAPSWCSMFVDPAVRCCVSVSPATRRMAVAGARAAPRTGGERRCSADLETGARREELAAPGCSRASLVVKQQGYCTSE